MNDAVFFCAACDSVSMAATIDEAAIARCRHLSFEAICQHCGATSRIALTDTMLSGSLEPDGRFRRLQTRAMELDEI